MSMMLTILLLPLHLHLPLAEPSALLKEVQEPSNAKYGSYAELVDDPDVNIFYVATPHSQHFQNAMLALQAGKHVLCETALTVNLRKQRS
jgi:predicted dehydrogenase